MMLRNQLNGQIKPRYIKDCTWFDSKMILTFFCPRKADLSVFSDQQLLKGMNLAEIPAELEERILVILCYSKDSNIVRVAGFSNNVDINLRYAPLRGESGGDTLPTWLSWEELDTEGTASFRYRVQVNMRSLWCFKKNDDVM